MSKEAIALSVIAGYFVIGWVMCAIASFFFNKYEDRGMSLLVGVLWPLATIIVVVCGIFEAYSYLVPLIPKGLAKCVLTVLRIVFTPWNIGRMYREWREGK